MGRLRLFWKLYATYLIAVALCAAVVGWYAVSSARDLYLAQVEDDLQSQALLVEQQVAGLIDTWSPTRLEGLVHNIGWASGTRITIIDTDGTVLADSELPASALDDHAKRPEVRAALEGRPGRAIRFSESLNEEMMYVAVPVFSASGEVTAVIRTAVPMAGMNDALRSLYRKIILGASAVALAVALLGLVVSRRISGQMRVIREGAERFAAGDFERKLVVSDSAEIGGVAVSLNRMADQLSATIETITQQSNEREAILSSMVEGVIAVDEGERILSMNQAAADLMGVGVAEADGRSIHEVIRNTDLQRLVAEAVASEDPVEGDMTLRIGGQSRYLQASGARLHIVQSDARGAVVVLNDITRLKHLERVRRDFVANVSHEIKTPVTSIKGFAETLAEGAIAQPEDALRFVDIIVRQADRLNAIIEDLLSLSRLESQAETGTLDLESGKVRDVLQVAAEVCSHKAGLKSVSLIIDCPTDLEAPINPPLLEQAVINLIDNAIKFSPQGEEIRVSAAPVGDHVVIAVGDHGSGIAREYLPRLFERFYRVDKARSRDLGGTGLGLAIVKHITQAHGGWVSVESTPGVGSLFELHLRSE